MGAVIDAVSADIEKDSLTIADPFSGGGVIALAGLLRGHKIYAQDVNPWAARGLATMLNLPDAAATEEAGQRLREIVEPLLTAAYTTELSDGSSGQLSQTLRVAVSDCPRCAAKLRLFPGSIVSLTSRVDRGGKDGWMACHAGHLSLRDTSKQGICSDCRTRIKPGVQYTAQRVVNCHACAWEGKVSDCTGPGGFRWEVALVERVGQSGREIDRPTVDEIKLADQDSWAPTISLPLIGEGGEAAVLRRHGYQHWHNIFPNRQRVVLESLLAAIPSATDEENVRQALEVAVISSAEMAGFISRWDSRYLKSYEALANHRFNVTTLSAEPNVWGTLNSGRGTVERRLAQYAKAAIWLNERIGRPLRVQGPLPASSRRTTFGSKDARVVIGSSERLVLPRGALDVVITDPPFHDDVQYSELSDLFNAWAGGHTGSLAGDVIVQERSDNTTARYQQTLETIFTEMKTALVEHGHLILCYANRNPQSACLDCITKRITGCRFRRGRLRDSSK